MSSQAIVSEPSLAIASSDRRQSVSLPIEPPQYLLLRDVPWDTYLGLSELLIEYPLRMTYDRGTLEIMTISHRHDWIKKLAGRMIEQMSLELDMDIKSAGSTTQLRRNIERSLEPDQSYYLANEPLVRFKDELDFDRDPAPDLVVEVDITSSSLDRMGMYAAMKVPELWRYDHVNDEVLIYHLTEEAEYRRSERSQSFPLLTAEVLNQFLRQRHSKSETEILRSFIEWTRSQIAQEKSDEGSPVDDHDAPS